MANIEINFDEGLIDQLPNKFVVVGIGTDVGKTLFSGGLIQQLAKTRTVFYWKPIQSGYPKDSDSRTLHRDFQLPKEQILPEWLLLEQPLSPHKCLRLEQKSFALKQALLPEIFHDEHSSLLIETAGGIYSPLNEEETNLDLIKFFRLPVVIVSRHYLGSLSHTLLTYEVLKREGIPMLGLLFLGKDHMEDEEFLVKKTQVPWLGHLSEEKLQ